MLRKERGILSPVRLPVPPLQQGQSVGLFLGYYKGPIR